jgi:hypothetical protein
MSLSRSCSTLIFVLLANFLTISVSWSHEIRPAVVEIDISQPKFVKLKALVNFEALMAGVSSQYGRALDHSEQDPKYEEFRKLSQTEFEQKIRLFLPVWTAGLELRLNGRKISLSADQITVREAQDTNLPRLTEVYLSGAKPKNIRKLYWSVKSEFGTSILRVKTNDENKIKAYWLKNAEHKNIDIKIKADENYFTTFFGYINVGFVHILPFGMDHILFILGLYFLSTRINLLIIQVTSFTIAHSITLALATIWADFQIAPSIIEPLIAASIVFIAIENFFTDRLSKWRPVIIFVFGLIHGVGFSGVLREVGFAGTDQLVALAGFSIGVEVGQISVICIAYLMVGYWFGRKVWYRRRIVQPCSLLIGMTGAFWLVERTLPSF